MQKKPVHIQAHLLFAKTLQKLKEKLNTHLAVYQKKIADLEELKKSAESVRVENVLTQTYKNKTNAV